MQIADHITEYYYRQYNRAMSQQNLTAAAKFYAKARKYDR